MDFSFFVIGQKIVLYNSRNFGAKFGGFLVVDLTDLRKCGDRISAIIKMDDSNGSAALDLEAQFSILPLVLTMLEKVQNGTDELEISRTVSLIFHL